MITRRGLLIALLLLTGCFSFAQVSFQVILPAAPPGGVGANCLATTYGYLAPVTGGSELVLCDPTTHTWTVQAGGGGGGNCTVAGSTGDLQMNNGSSGCGASHVNDNGTTVASSEPITATSISTGTSPPAVTPGTGGVWACKEGTAPSVGIPAAGVDGLYCDSATHQILASVNNGAFAPLGGGGSWATPTYPFGGLSSQSSGVTFSSSNNKISFFPISAGTISSVSYWQASAESGSHVAAGIYDSTCTLISNGNSLTVTTVGANTVLTFTFATNPSLNGYGWIGISSDNAGGTTTAFPGSIDTGNGNNATLANSAQTTVFTGSNSSTGTATITMPSTCGTKTAIASGGGVTFPTLFMWH